MSRQLSHKFSRIPAPGQLSFAFLADLPAAAPSEPFVLTAPVARVSVKPVKPKAPRKPKPLSVAAANQLALELVVLETVAAPVKRETVYDFLVRTGKLDNYTKNALKASKVARALTDDELRKDLSQDLHIRWREMLVDPTKTELQTFKLAALSGPQAVQKSARANTGAVYIPDSARRSCSDYASLVTASRNPHAVDDFVDSTLLSVEDDVEDRADNDFLAARLATLDIDVTSTMRRIAELMLLDGILDAHDIADEIGLTVKSVRAAMAKLTGAFEAANDRDMRIGQRRAA